jgi:RNA polymerase sigma-70 factor (ECF subfamily)
MTERVGPARDEPLRPRAAQVDSALADFVTDHYDRLIRLAGLVCRDGTDAGDAVQRGLERAWKNRATLRDESRIRPWLDRIVVREAIRVGRSRQSLVGRLFTSSSRVTWIEHAKTVAAPQRPAADLVAMTALHAAFASLKADQRAVVALHLYAGYSVQETAELVGARIETVRSRLRLAKDRLRRELQETDR